MKMSKEIDNLILELQKYDDPKGYKLEYGEIKEKLSPVIKELTSLGEEALNELHILLSHEETWSSVFALEALKEIKSEKSIQYLIDYIVKTEKGSSGDFGEDAMLTLTNIGEPAIDPLLKEIRNQFEKRTFCFYLVGALTEIKSEKVYNFMKEITKDYIKNEEKYDEWFYIDAFVADFDKQGKKEILLLLEKLVTLDRISKSERIEIKDTIESTKDPIGFRKKLDKEIKEATPIIKEYLEEEKQMSVKKINEKELEKRMWTPEEDLEIQFKCPDCNKKQNINPGIIKILGDKQSEFSFENEILCKYCFSNNLKQTIQGGRDIMFQSIGILDGSRTGVVFANNKVYVENKPMPFKKTYNYILKRIKEEPENGGLYLRAGNVARNFNKYYEAIKHYEKAIELNPNLIAIYLNLVEIYEFRYKYYGIGDAKVSAVFYLNEMVDVFRNQGFDILTLQNEGSIIQFIGEKSESLGISFPEIIKIPIQSKKEKVGRNDPCPCGSGKKYKKCCLNKEIGK